MGNSASRVEGKFYYVIPGEVDANGDPIYHCRACDYVCKNPSGIRLHWLKKHGDVAGQAPLIKKADKPLNWDARTCTVCGGPLALLRAQNPRHSIALHAGYRLYCEKCEEVYP